MNPKNLRTAVPVLFILALFLSACDAAEGSQQPSVPVAQSVATPTVTSTPTPTSIILSAQTGLPTLSEGQQYAVLPWQGGRLPSVGETLNGMAVVAIVGIGNDATVIGVADDPAVLGVEAALAVYVVVIWATTGGPEIAAEAVVESWDALTAWVVAMSAAEEAARKAAEAAGLDWDSLLEVEQRLLVNAAERGAEAVAAVIAYIQAVEAWDAAENAAIQAWANCTRDAVPSCVQNAREASQVATQKRQAMQDAWQRVRAR